jgi:hypothetical protein
VWKEITAKKKVFPIYSKARVEKDFFVYRIASLRLSRFANICGYRGTSGCV